MNVIGCKIVLLSACWVLSLGVRAQEIEIEDLKYTWNIYNSEDKKLDPYFGQEANSVFFELQTSPGSIYLLKLKLPAETFCYMNDKMYGFNLSDTTQWISLDSLYRVFGERINIALYSEELEHPVIETKIVQRLVNGQSGNLASMPIQHRSKNEQKDYLIILGILIFGMLLGYRTINFKMFSEYFSPLQAFALRQRFDVIGAQDAFSAKNLSFILLYGVMLGAGVYASHLTQSEIFDLSKSRTPIMTGLIVAAASVILLLLKYPLILILSELFKIRKTLHLHFMVYSRFSLLISVLFFSVCVINGLSSNALWLHFNDVIVFMTIIVLLSRVLMIFLILNSRLIFYKLHLFTYLCTTEIFPLTVFLKFLL